MKTTFSTSIKSSQLQSSTTTFHIYRTSTPTPSPFRNPAQHMSLSTTTNSKLVPIDLGNVKYPHRSFQCHNSHIVSHLATSHDKQHANLKKWRSCCHRSSISTATTPSTQCPKRQSCMSNAQRTTCLPDTETNLSPLKEQEKPSSNILARLHFLTGLLLQLRRANLPKARRT